MAQPAPVAPAPPRGKTGLWIALAVIGLAGIGAGAFFVLRGPPSQAPASQPAYTPPPPAAPAMEPDKKFTGPKGFSLMLPGNLVWREDTGSGGAMAHGFIDGSEVVIVVLPVDEGASQDSIVNALLHSTTTTATLIEKRTRVIRGRDVLSVIYEIPSQGRLESCLLPGPPGYVVTFVTDPANFDRSATFRDSLFRDRFDAH